MGAACGCSGATDCFIGVSSFERRSMPLSRLTYFSNLKAWVHWLLRNPGMHQSIQRGSSARAAMMPPQSNGSHPNCWMTPETSDFALESLPHKNIVGGPWSYCGLIIFALP